jgi:hypothetical protein
MDNDERRWGATPVALETDQTGDGIITRALGPQAAVRLLYLRCHEAQTQGLRGQDFACLADEGQGHSVCFCVCDGVGSSYRGDFAACFLARRLVDLLRELESVWRDPDTLHAELVAALEGWAPEAQARLLGERIPPNTPALAREVLQDLRDDYGSETVFLGGRIERGGRGDASVLLCGMGNVTPRLRGTPLDRRDLDLAGDDANRWSTVRRLRGRLALRQLRLDRLDRLIVHTDGAERFAASIERLDDLALYEQASRTRLAPQSDDVTVLDILWSQGTHAAHAGREIQRG